LSTRFFSGLIYAYEKALVIDPFNVQANLGIAGVLLRDPNQVKSAKYYAQTALNILSEHDTPSEYDLGSAYVGLAMAAEYEEKYRDAIFWFQKAVDLSSYPEGRSCISISRIYQTQDQHSKVDKWITCALHATTLLIDQGNISQAMKDYHLILSVDPDNQQAKNELERLVALNGER